MRSDNLNDQWPDSFYDEPDIRASGLVATQQKIQNLLESEQAPAMHVQWMFRRDLPEVVNINSGSTLMTSHDPWDEETIVRNLRERNVIGMVAVDSSSQRVLGFIIYTFRDINIEINHLAIEPSANVRAVTLKILGIMFDKIGQIVGRRNLTICVDIKDEVLLRVLKELDFRFPIRDYDGSMRCVYMA